MSLASLLSADFRVERSALVAAAPETVFSRLEDLRAWRDWSPWEKQDPGMTRTYGGAARGAGAVYEWDGNKEVGAGRMEVVEAAAPRRVVLALDFRRPFEGHDRVEFVLAPEGGGTRVTWTMTGRKHPVMRVMGLVFDVDGMIGRQFEAGLASLKALVEGRRRYS